LESELETTLDMLDWKMTVAFEMQLWRTVENENEEPPVFVTEIKVPIESANAPGTFEFLIEYNLGKNKFLYEGAP
jgi:hypothetical protein